VRQHLQADMEELTAEVEKANANAAGMEKKQKQFDRWVIVELRGGILLLGNKISCLVGMVTTNK